MSNPTSISNASAIINMVLDEECRTPAPLWHEGTLYITDGRILIAMDNQPQPEGAWPCDGVMFNPHRKENEKTWQRPIAIKTITQLIEPVGQCSEQMPQVDGPPGECDRLWQCSGECDQCDGRGWRQCNMGHDHDCDDCDGEGIAIETHPAAKERLTVLGVLVARRYAWIISQLPGVLIGQTEQADKLAFRFDGGVGVLMGLRP